MHRLPYAARAGRSLGLAVSSPGSPSQPTDRWDKAVTEILSPTSRWPSSTYPVPRWVLCQMGGACGQGRGACVGSGSGFTPGELQATFPCRSELNALQTNDGQVAPP